MSPLNNKNTSIGQEYWRSLEERADSPEFREWLKREFPAGASELDHTWSRRKFLTLMGASFALAGLTSCRRPLEKIIPFVTPPENITPGLPEFYATSMPCGNQAYGLIVEAHEGRPTKIEGNELCPSTRGRSNLQMQAAILDLYDPDRSNSVRHQGNTRSWDNFVSAWADMMNLSSRSRGTGVAVLSAPFSSPTLARLKREFARKYPKATWTTWEPVSDENVYAGIELATGRRYQPLYHYDKAEVILSLDSDFLSTESGSVTAAKGFAAGRGIQSEHDSMNRLYVVESLFSITGASADHRLAVVPHQITGVARAIATEMRARGARVHSGITAAETDLSPEQLEWIRPLAADLIKAGSRSLITVGRRQPASVHALAMLLNQALGNDGTTVGYVDPQDAVYSSARDLADLTARMNKGEVSTLVILGGNPIYNAPADLSFKEALVKVETSIHFSSHIDETSTETTWHVPRAHFLESWGDTRSADGSVGLIQPLIQPLFGGISDVSMMDALVTGGSRSGYDIVRSTWRKQWGLKFDRTWSKVLHDGILEGSQSRKVTPQIRASRVAQAHSSSSMAGMQSLQAVFHADHSMADGSSANNGWLQELPDPITKLTWDNVASLSPATAKSLGVKNEDVVRLAINGRHLSMPVWIVPGQAHHTVGLALGYGRSHAGRVGNSVGKNTYLLRSHRAPDFESGLTLTPTGETHALANTQDHGSMEGRPIVREATLEEYRKHPEFAKEAVEHPPLVSLWNDREYNEGYQWGMAIDLSKCTGCSVCTIACQSENNIPVVGKDETRKGREMSWIRIDRYFVGDLDDPRIVHQPVACHHCENAPCEQVCPVAATVHDKEGLNAMVYNRCVGTRYCANNCPYKVRRFNFYNLTKDMPEVEKMAQNPDVTVRSRGVMEKCSYCLQRIVAGKRTAKLEGREVRDHEIKTACQQACPSDAIAFGNIRDPESEVSRVKEQNRNYELLAELNLKPRTSYLARVHNPNPEMPG